MKNYFIPVTEIGLVEFLSSGFIGISTSKVDYEDIHTRLWPNAIVAKNLEDSPLPICCEIEAKGRAYSLPAKIGNKKIQLFRIKSALSINDIKSIYFSTEDSLNEFVSKYHYMSDLNIEGLPLRVSESLVDCGNFLLNDAEGDLSLIERKKDNNIDGYSKSKLISDGKSIIAFSYAFSKHLMINSSREIAVLSRLDDVDVALCDISSMLNVKLPPKSFNFLLKEYWELCRSERIDARSDQMEVVELLQAKLYCNRAEYIEVQKTISFLEKISNVFMGMEPHPQLDDKSPEKAFQFGFYVSLIAKTAKEFTELRNRFRFSDQVESIAKYFFALRSRLSQHDDDFFGSFGTSKNSWASAILDCYFSSQATLEIYAKKGKEDLQVACDLLINKVRVGSTIRDMSPEEQLVVSTLRTFSIEPFRDESSGDIAVKKYVHSNPIIVTFKLFSSIGSNQLNEVLVKYESSAKHSFLSKAAPRLKILKLASEQGLALGVNNEGTLLLTRLQIVNTMDRDELWHHVEQVAVGGALMEELVSNS